MGVLPAADPLADAATPVFELLHAVSSEVTAATAAIAIVLFILA
jgi:hypothetical protein